MSRKHRMILGLIPMAVALAAGSPTFGAIKAQGNCPGNREIVNLLLDPNSPLIVYDENSNNMICVTVGTKNIRYSDDKA